MRKSNEFSNLKLFSRNGQACICSPKIVVNFSINFFNFMKLTDMKTIWLQFSWTTGFRNFGTRLTNACVYFCSTIPYQDSRTNWGRMSPTSHCLQNYVPSASFCICWGLKGVFGADELKTFRVFGHEEMQEVLVAFISTCIAFST